jgi:hypothetical protein
MLDEANFFSRSHTFAIKSVFWYTAGFVLWSASELEALTAMCVRGYCGAWGLLRFTDDSFFRVSCGHRGRECLSTMSVWVN